MGFHATRAAAAAILLLLPLPAAAGAPTVAVLRLRGAQIGATTAGPATVPIGFGQRDLGDIVTASGQLCFLQPSSPSTACDASGTVALVDGLASPFFLAGAFRTIVATGASSLVTFPVSLQAGERLDFFIHWAADREGPVSDALTLRATPSGEPAEDLILQLSGTGVAPGVCFPFFDAMCLGASDRFKVSARFLTPAADEGEATGVRLTQDTGYLWFFSSSNVETVLKVLNACAFNDRYWVFAGGLTNVRTLITVTDTQRSAVRIYINPLNRPFPPIQDTSAFATCP